MLAFECWCTIGLKAQHLRAQDLSWVYGAEWLRPVRSPQHQQEHTLAIGDVGATLQAAGPPLGQTQDKSRALRGWAFSPIVLHVMYAFNGRTNDLRTFPQTFADFGNDCGNVSIKFSA